MSGDLDSILNGDDQPVQEIETPEAPETQTEPEATPEPTAEEPNGPVRDEKGRFAPKGETEGVSPTPEKEPEFDHKAVLGERRRRQEAEERARQLEERLTQIERRFQPQPEAIDDDLMYTDPAKYRQLMAAEIRREVQQEAKGLTEQSAITVRMDVSEMLARKSYADYDEKLGTFRDMVAENPNLAAELARQQDPAEWAYQKAASWSAIQEVGSIDALREKIRAEVLAEVQPARPAPVIPESLADAPAAGASGVVPQAPLSLDAIIGRRG